MKFLRILFVCAIIAALTVSWFSKATGKRYVFSSFTSTHARDPDKKAVLKLKEKVVLARSFVIRKEYNNKFGFFIDMSLPSGQPRFFIYDLQKDSLISKGLVAHGNCFEYWLEGRRYSNVVGSGCTSLGKYKIGASYTGKFGYSYKLHGLDSTNSKAFERTVVLHSHSCIPDTETADEICQSNGCPTVSPGFLQQLKNIVNSSKKPLLLWIYD